MKKINSYQEISQVIMSNFRRGMVTNHVVSREKLERNIKNSVLFTVESEHGLLLFTDSTSHYSMHFYAHSEKLFENIPSLERPIVCEIASRVENSIYDSAISSLSAQGFEKEFSRKRYILPKNTRVQDSKNDIVTANINDFNNTKILLNSCFSSLTGCLPSDEELIADITNGRILIHSENGSLASMLHFTEDKKSLEIRHLCTAKEFRGRSLASAMVDKFLSSAKAEGKKITVWVRDGYSEAESIYKKHGFTPDGMVSDVYIKKTNNQ